MEKINPKLLWLFILSAVVYFGQGIEGLPGQALFYYLKETLKYNEQTIMYISSLITLAWLIKPLIGFMVDKFRFSKKFWIVSSLLVSSGISLFLGFSPILSVPLIIGALMIANWNAAVRDVTVDGVMCIEGKKKDLTGRIQSIQWIAITVASILCGVGGGWIAENFSYQISYLFLIPFYGLMIYATLQYKEVKKRVIKGISFVETMKKLFTDRNLLLVAAFLFLYKFSPSFGTPLMFIERDVFHWSKIWIGWLGTISAVVSIGGAYLYWHLCRKINIRQWLLVSVWIGALTTLAYLYFTPVTDVVYTIIGSVIGMFVQLLALDFMARSTQTNMEATSFALLASVSNLAGTLNGLIGGFLFPIVGLQWLIVISATTSFLCLPLINRIKFKE